MIYVTGCSGLIGRRFIELYRGDVKKISYRNDPLDVFDEHDQSCLIHFAWSSTTRNTYDDMEEVVKNDVINSKKLFDFYLKKNPKGKIIFLSTAGALYIQHTRTVTEESYIKSNSLYADCKIQVENILNTLPIDTTIFRVSNVWGGKYVTSERKNGLIDKLLVSLNSDNIIDIYANLDTRIDIIHVDDLVSLIIKAIDKQQISLHEMFVVGSQSLTIKDVIDIISNMGSLLLRIKKNDKKNYLHIENSRAKKYFDWNPTRKLV